MVAPLHKQGTDDGWHGMITEGGEFLPEKDRYHLYIGAYDVSPSISI
jgi:putative glutathione S-transferase